jgi:hypothetical protein
MQNHAGRYFVLRYFAIIARCCTAGGVEGNQFPFMHTKQKLYKHTDSCIYEIADNIKEIIMQSLIVIEF